MAAGREDGRLSGRLLAALALTLLLAAGGWFAACGDAGADGQQTAYVPSLAADSPPAGAGPTRSFALGFTPFPYAISQQAIEDVRHYLAEDGDLVVMHFDSGVPWAEALAGQLFPKTLVDDITYAVAAAPPGHVRVLQFTPISFLRAGLAAEPGGAPLRSPWDARDFDHPDVVTAFIAYARSLIAQTEPDYVNYGIEANLLLANGPSHWDAYLAFLAQVYPALKAAFPDIPFFLSIQLEAFAGDPAQQAPAIQQMMPYSDLVAVSAYPYIGPNATPAAVPDDFFSTVAALAPDKPFAISETGWPAEDLGAPYPVTVRATTADQQAWAERVLDECDALQCEFLNWFVVRDYDQLFDQLYAGDPSLGSVARIWRDIGLYTGDGEERPALATWREWLSRPRE